MHMLCRNRVSDYDRWLQVFTSHERAHEEAGLILEHLWRASSDPAQVFFLFRVDDGDKARRFVSAPEAVGAAATAGVLDGEYHFLDTVED
jgi:hypothetical protein